MAYKSKRSKATDISLKVRKEVYERSNGVCETCGTYCDDMGYSNSHFIPRSSGGLGIPQNILHQCIECHRVMDFGHGEEKDKMIVKCVNVFKSHYPNWNKEDLIYRR